MKNFLFFLSIALIFPALAEEERIVAISNPYGGAISEVVYSNGDKEFIDIKKEIRYFDQSHQLRKLEYYPSESYMKRKGVNRQINFYSNDKLNRMSTEYSKTRSEESGIDSIVQYYEEDKIVTCDFFIGKKLIFHTEKKDLATTDFKLLSFYAKNSIAGKLPYSEHSASNGKKLFVDKEGNRSLALIRYLGKTAPIEEEEKTLVLFWAREHKITENKIKDAFKKKMLVKEGSNEFWILYDEEFNESQIEKNPGIIVIYLFIGAVDGKPVFFAYNYWLARE